MTSPSRAACGASWEPRTATTLTTMTPGSLKPRACAARRAAKEFAPFLVRPRPIPGGGSLVGTKLHPMGSTFRVQGFGFRDAAVIRWRSLGSKQSFVQVPVPRVHGSRSLCWWCTLEFRGEDRAALIRRRFSPSA